jgi:hypothetical protein
VRVHDRRVTIDVADALVRTARVHGAGARQGLIDVRLDRESVRFRTGVAQLHDEFGRELTLDVQIPLFDVSRREVEGEAVHRGIGAGGGGGQAERVRREAGLQEEHRGGGGSGE